MAHDLTLDPASAFDMPRLSRAHRAKGQTFPEMMIVVAIIAILAAVITANLFHARAVAQLAAAEQNATEISAAMELYFNDYQIYPGTGNWQNVMAVLPASYMPAAPCDPLDKACTQSVSSYQVATNGSAYMIYDTIHYPSNLLANLPFSWADFNPTIGTCGPNNCTRAMYSSSFGLAGIP